LNGDPKRQANLGCLQAKLNLNFSGA